MVLLIDRSVIDDGTTAQSSAEDVAARVLALEQEGLSARDALKRAARELGLSRSEAYRRLTASKALDRD